jgi:hypothetical protein
VSEYEEKPMPEQECPVELYRIVGARDGEKVTDRVSRAQVDIRVICEAPGELIEPSIPRGHEILKRYAYSLPLPCNGEGHPGAWCYCCFWSSFATLGKESDT